MYGAIPEPHANEWAISESGINKSPIPSFDLCDWCFVTVFRHHSTSAFSVGVHLNIVWRFGAAVQVVDIRDGGGGMVETRVERNWEIPVVCWQLDFEALRFALCMWDSTVLIPIVLSLKHFLLKIHCALYKLPGTGFSNPDKSLLDIQFSLNLYFPMLSDCYLNNMHLLWESWPQTHHCVVGSTLVIVWRYCYLANYKKKNKCYRLLLDLRLITINHTTIQSTNHLLTFLRLLKAWFKTFECQLRHYF